MNNVDLARRCLSLIGDNGQRGRQPAVTGRKKCLNGTPGGRHEVKGVIAVFVPLTSCFIFGVHFSS
jgi:hypothetical protein